MSDDKEKVRVLEGGKTPNMTADAVRQMRANLPMLREHVELLAELQWVKFNALVDKGFSEGHAIELCKSVF